MSADGGLFVIRFNPHYFDVSSLIGSQVAISAHDPLAGMKAAFLNVPAILPNLEPFPELQPPSDTSLPRPFALF